MLILPTLCLNAAFATEPTAAPTATTHTRIFAEGTAWRNDGKVEITNVFGFVVEPKVGERVTVFPLGGLPPIELKITGTTARTEGSAWWEVDLEAVSRSDLLAAKAPEGRRDEYPFDACVLYPASSSAKLVSEPDPAALPKGVVAATIQCAVDVTGDGNPDALRAAFCCKQPTIGAKSSRCEYTCSKTYLKRGGKWDEVDSSSPM